MLNMDAGELRAMTPVRSIGIALTNRSPPDSLNAWDLADVIDRALAY